MVWQKGDKSLILGEYPCPNGCGRILTMPGAVARHASKCVVTLEQLRLRGNALDTSDNECWLWPGATETDRGVIYFTSPVTNSVRKRYVYVAAYILATGVDPEVSKQLICHHCDDGRCFNPKCLFMGTSQDNRQDMIIKGRAKGLATVDPEEQRQIAVAAGRKGGQAPCPARKTIRGVL